MESTILKFSVIAFGIEILLMLGGFISLCCYYRFNEKLNAMFYNRLKQVEKECKWKLDAYDKLIQKEKPGVSVKGPGTTATAPKTPAPQTVPAPSVGGEMNMDDEIDKLLDEKSESKANRGDRGVRDDKRREGDPRMFIQEMPQSREPLPPESKKGGKAKCSTDNSRDTNLTNDPTAPRPKSKDTKETRTKDKTEKLKPPPAKSARAPAAPTLRKTAAAAAAAAAGTPTPPVSGRQRAPSLQAQATMNNSHKETVVTPLRLSKEKAGDEVTQFTVEMTCEDGSDRAAV